METALLIGIAIVGVLLAVWATLKPIMDDNKVRGKVLNFDEGMKNYYFLLPESGERLLDALRAQPEQKTLDYSLLPQEERIRFRLNGVEAEYRLRFAERDGKSVLQLSRTAAEREKGSIPYLVNAFFIRNFEAKPLPYQQAETLFEEETA